jgi:hypothetical protein
MEEIIQLRDEAAKLISKIWFHIGQEHIQFINGLRQWFFFIDEEFDMKVWAQRESEIFEAAQKIMSERKEELSFIPTPSTTDHSSAPPSG